MKKFFNIYRNILLVIAVFLAMVMILPLAFQVKPYIVLSPSMEPTIHTGDVCYIQKYEENEKPEIGSIVAFVLNDNETMFVHRIVDAKDGYYVTQGDANDTVDLYQPAEEAIVGRAVFIIPYLGTVVSWAKSSQGLIVMAVAVLISILSSFLDTDERKVKKEKKKNVGKIEELSLFDEKYNELKTEKSANARTLSDIIKERQKIRNDMMVREKEEWVDDIFATDFEEIKSQEEQFAENVDVAEENADNNEDYVDAKEASVEVETEHVENNESTENEEELVFDFDNMSVEEETRKIFEKHSATISESLDEVSATSYQSVSKIGLNTIIDDIEAKEDDEETFDVTKYAEKYLGNEASEITADTLLFEDDVNDWLFMPDDENSVSMMRYRENIMKSVRKKLESGIYNSSDNFSPSAIYKRAQEALEDDLTDEENNIMNIITVDNIKTIIENDDENDIEECIAIETKKFLEENDYTTRKLYEVEGRTIWENLIYV